MICMTKLCHIFNHGFYQIYHKLSYETLNNFARFHTGSDFVQRWNVR